MALLRDTWATAKRLHLLTQEAIDQYQTDRARMTFILFDEIEKASDALWQLLLGILDKGTLTLGDNRRVDLSRCVIFMTSNLGAVEMTDMLQGGGIGFTSGCRSTTQHLLQSWTRKLYRTALEVAKRKFSPEFMNRLDKVVVFRTLTGRGPAAEFSTSNSTKCRAGSWPRRANRQFVFHCTQESKEFLLREGTDLKYGARHLKRAIERHLVFPLSNLIATGQISQGDVIKVDLHGDGDKLTFVRERVMPSFGLEATSVAGTANRKANKDWRPSGCSRRASCGSRPNSGKA